MILVTSFKWNFLVRAGNEFWRIVNIVAANKNEI